MTYHNRFTLGLEQGLVTVWVKEAAAISLPDSVTQGTVSIVVKTRIHAIVDACTSISAAVNLFFEKAVRMMSL